MLKIVSTILFVFAVTAVSAQSTTHCREYNRRKALEDIKNKEASLIIRGGIMRNVYPQDSVFSKKYKIGFYDSGDTLPDSEECVIAYNKTIFKYLDKRYGKKWRKMVRKDVMGL